MIVTCTQCSSKFTVNDEKIQNRIFLFECPDCSKEVIIDNRPDKKEISGLPPELPQPEKTSKLYDSAKKIKSHIKGIERIIPPKAEKLVSEKEQENKKTLPDKETAEFSGFKTSVEDIEIDDLSFRRI